MNTQTPKPYTPAEMTATFCKDCPKSQRQATTDWFAMTLSMLDEGGTYVYPAKNKVFKKVGNKFQLEA